MLTFCVPETGPVSLRQHLIAAGAQPAGLGTYEVLRVEAGVPEFGIDLDDNRLVFEVGRTAQAISYTKGCYLGQEPIVMARDRGHVNRLLLGLKLTGDSAVSPGSKVIRDGQEIGLTTSSVVSPRLGALALAYLHAVTGRRAPPSRSRRPRGGPGPKSPPCPFPVERTG